MLHLVLAQLLTQADPEPVDQTEFHGEVSLPMLPSKRKAPLIELTIGGKPYHFMLDTGATGGRISPAIVQSLGLKPIGEVRAGDPSGKNTRTVQVYRIPEIHAGSATFHGVRMFADAGRQGGPDTADGVIGYAVFRELLLVLDYPNKRVLLQKGDLPSSAMHYNLEHGIPTLPIKVGAVSIEGHVDSGSDGGLYIPIKYKPKLHLDGEPKLLGHAKTLFNDVDIYGVKVKDAVTIGGKAFKVPMIEMHDLFPYGNIGGRLLSLYKVTIDQRHKRIQFDKG